MEKPQCTLMCVCRDADGRRLHVRTIARLRGDIMRFDGVCFLVNFQYNKKDKNTYLKAYYIKKHVDRLNNALKLQYK